MENTMMDPINSR